MEWGRRGCRRGRRAQGARAAAHTAGACSQSCAELAADPGRHKCATGRRWARGVLQAQRSAAHQACPAAASAPPSPPSRFFAAPATSREAGGQRSEACLAGSSTQGNAAEHTTLPAYVPPAPAANPSPAAPAHRRRCLGLARLLLLPGRLFCRQVRELLLLQAAQDGRRESMALAGRGTSTPLACARRTPCAPAACCAGQQCDTAKQQQQQQQRQRRQ